LSGAEGSSSSGIASGAGGSAGGGVRSVTPDEGSGSSWTTVVTCATGAVGISAGSDFFPQETRITPVKHPAIASQAVGFMVAGYALGRDPRQGKWEARRRHKESRHRRKRFPNAYVPEVVDVSVEVEVSVVVGVTGVVGTCAARNNWNHALANPVGT